jgi:Uma2 family endonuclease
MNSTATSQNTSTAKPLDPRIVLKSEVIEGKSIPRPASNRWHNIIATNFVVAIGGRVQRGNHDLYANDMRVKFGRNSVCLPAVVVVTGEPEFSDNTDEILLNPTLLIEIFSPGTRATDRTEKLEGFLAIPKLKECLLVNEQEMRIEHWSRQNPKQWIYRIYNEKDDSINLESIGCKMSLSEAYSQVKLRESELSSRAVN